MTGGHLARPDPLAVIFAEIGLLVGRASNPGTGFSTTCGHRPYQAAVGAVRNHPAAPHGRRSQCARHPLALGLYTGGILGRLVAEAWESIDTHARDALRHAGVRGGTATLIATVPPRPTNC